MKFAIFSIMLFTTLILIIPGILVKYCKAYWLISGYNTMSTEKKKNVDVFGLSKLVGNFCFVLAGILLFAGLFAMVNQMVMAGIMAALIVPASIYMLVKAQAYDGNTRNPGGTMKMSTKILIGSISAFLILALIGVGILMSNSSKPPEFSIAEGYLEIHGLYGEKISLKDIKEIALKESLPEITYKTNGSALGSKMKGNFKLKGIEEAKLFLDTSKPPFIYISRAAKPVILNSDSAEKTKELYDLLMAELQKNK